MSKDWSKYIFPGLLILIGVILFIFKFWRDQNNLFLLGGAAILVTGIISLLNALEKISKGASVAVWAVMLVASIGLAFSDYMSIKEPLDFLAEKDRRYEHVKQHLIDIRTAQIAYKGVNQRYTDNFDSLLHFVKNDSFLVIKATGEIPDSLQGQEARALELGIIERDTGKVSVFDSLFAMKPEKLEDRIIKSFNLDSLAYVPFTNGAKFELSAGTVERGSVVVPVFMAIDSKPFDPRHALQVGSMTDPTTNGNWGE